MYTKEPRIVPDCCTFCSPQLSISFFIFFLYWNDFYSHFYFYLNKLKQNNNTVTKVKTSTTNKKNRKVKTNMYDLFNFYVRIENNIKLLLCMEGANIGRNTKHKIII